MIDEHAAMLSTLTQTIKTEEPGVIKKKTKKKALTRLNAAVE